MISEDQQDADFFDYDEMDLSKDQQDADNADNGGRRLVMHCNGCVKLTMILIGRLTR